MGSMRAEAPCKVAGVRLSPEEIARVKRAARVNNQRPSDFMRDAIVTAMEECLEEDDLDEKDGICSP